MSNSPGAYRELTQEPSLYGHRRHIDDELYRVFKPGSKAGDAHTRNYYCLSGTTIHLHRISFARESESAVLIVPLDPHQKHARRRAQHPIRKLLTHRVRVLFEKWTGSTSWPKCKVVSCSTVPKSRNRSAWRYDSFSITDWVAELLRVYRWTILRKGHLIVTSLLSVCINCLAQRHAVLISYNFS